MNLAEQRLREPWRGHLVASFPIAYTQRFMDAFEACCPEHKVTLLSGYGDEVRMLVRSQLTRAELEQWDERYERLCRELGLG